MNLLSGLCIAATCFSVILTGLVLKLNPRAPLNRWVAALAVAYSYWSFWATFVYSTGNPGVFWFAYRMALVGSTVTQPLTVAMLLAVAGIRRWPAWMLATPVLALSLTEVVKSFAGSLLITGYRLGPWGNVGILTTDPLWLTFTAATATLTFVINLGILIWAWRAHPSRAYRSSILRFGAIGLLSALGSQFCIQVVWLTWGYPDLNVFVGFLVVLACYALVSRYEFLRDNRPKVEGALFQSLNDLVILADATGYVAQASTRAARVLGQSEAALRGRKLTEVLGSWPGLAEGWEAMGRDHAPREGLEGALGSSRFLLSLVPNVNRFDDIDGVLVRLNPAESLDEASQRFGISAREREVAALLLRGSGTQEIATALFISHATVKNHLHSLFRKTATTNRVELVRVLLDGGFHGQVKDP